MRRESGRPEGSEGLLRRAWIQLVRRAKSAYWEAIRIISDYVKEEETDEV